MDTSYGQQAGFNNAGVSPGVGQLPNAHYSQPQSINAAYVENGLHPVPPPSDKIVSSHYVQYDQYKPVPASAGQPYGAAVPAAQPKKRICSLSRPLFILSCISGLLLAVLVIVAGAFGSMLARQSSQILNLQNAAATAATKTTQPDSANGTATSAAPAATTTWIDVNNWEFIGCWEDGDERVFPDQYTHIANQTNRLCASACDGFAYFGTQFGDQCYCSKTPPKTAAPPWNCDMHCAGAQNSEICGGYFFLSAWKRK